jgi:hypothetical protein
LRATHLKGLLREVFQDLASQSGWEEGAVNNSFGSPGWGPELRKEKGPPGEGLGQEAAFTLSDAVAVLSKANMDQTLLISRTAVEDYGVAVETSLRTTEAVAAGTKFEGEVIVHPGPGAAKVELAVRLALLALPAVGGGRTRGAGRCVVNLADEKRTFKDLLAQLEAQLHAPYVQTASKAAQAISGKSVWRRIIFRAQSPVCCPVGPQTGNVITSGFTIPASAVQGALLHRLNAIKSELASACFESASFRAWPLLPCEYQGASEPLPIPYHVSITHHQAKIISADIPARDAFQDEAIEDLRTLPDRTPLKGSDGVLLRYPDGAVKLWRSKTMPRELSAHAVPGEENLFSVEAMAPLVFSGWLACPQEAVEELERSLRQDPNVHLGKTRSVRGSGELQLNAVNEKTDILESQAGDQVLAIAQSPLQLLENVDPNESCDDELERLAKQWAKESDIPPPDVLWAACGLRFGWNRHGKGQEATPGRQGRLRAQRVVLPGAVLKWKQGVDPSKLRAALLKGLGKGRELGFGALAIHPGKATAPFEKPPTRYQIPNGSPEAVRKGMSFFEACCAGGPSPSQIFALQQRFDCKDKRGALEYLAGQAQRSVPRIQAAWKPLLKDNAKESDFYRYLSAAKEEDAALALRVWADRLLTQRALEAQDNNRTEE